jgi:hypothetical protein
MRKPSVMLRGLSLINTCWKTTDTAVTILCQRISRESCVTLKEDEKFVL